MPSAQSGSRSQHASEKTAYPTRQYIGAMCLEMARMAAEDGDDQLADALRKAAKTADSPKV